MILFLIPMSLKAQELQCMDSVSLQKWVSSLEASYADKKISHQKLKQLYLGDSIEGKSLTLFYPHIFKDKVLMGNLAIDCHNNLLKALKPKNKNRKLSIDLWKRCTHRLYEGKEKKLVDKAVGCLVKQPTQNPQ